LLFDSWLTQLFCPGCGVDPNYVNYEFTDEQWKRIQPLLPPEYTKKKGHPRKDNRTMLNGMLDNFQSAADVYK